MIRDIDKHIALIDESIVWAKNYEEGTFPINVFKEYRRALRKIRVALEENCSAAAYGESQVGKSYLMSSLLSSFDSPFVIKNGQKEYSFIDDLNPSGGATTKTESTGVITRFTITKGNKLQEGLVSLRLLSVVDIILLITDSYYNDIKLNPNSILKYDDINAKLETLSPLWEGHNIPQTIITEDDIKDIYDYVKDVIGNNAASVHQSNFCKIVAPIIQYVTYDKWVDVFSLLWNQNPEMSRLFTVLINEYKKLGFNTNVYVPFDAVLREKGTILKIEWLDTVCGVNIDTGKDTIYTDVYDVNRRVLASNFSKGYLSALIAELTFELPETIAEERKFLEKIDLLDFPGARSREKYKEDMIHEVLPKVLRRGKVAYLFNKYSRSLLISSVLFCHHNDQKTEPTLGETINNWIEENIGHTPEERAIMLRQTNGIAPLFMIATKFNNDLEITKKDKPSDVDSLNEHWQRFDKVIPEIIKPNTWMDQWVTKEGIFATTAFQNIFPLRDFYWSGKCNLFKGYSDGKVKSPEVEECVHPEFPNYMQSLRSSFLRNAFVNKHFADPNQTWNDVATINNDGSKAIIKNLSNIAENLDGARKNKYKKDLENIQKQMLETLSSRLQPEDNEQKNKQVKSILGEIRSVLVFAVGKKPETFGQIMDSLMVPVSELRDIAYNIAIRHTETPKDFSTINLLRALTKIDITDERGKNIQKLLSHFNCDQHRLGEILKENGVTIDEIVSEQTETLTTVADVITKNIIDYWKDYLNVQAKELESTLPHAGHVVKTLINLLTKLDVKKVLSEKISTYCNKFHQNELPNAIADFASLTLNNFVSNVGRDFLSDNDINDIQSKAQDCGLSIDLSPDSVAVTRKPQPLIETLRALDKATDVINQPNIDMEVLRNLPFWGNFLRWMNLLTIGLIYASDIATYDPVANDRMKKIIAECEKLYN